MPWQLERRDEGWCVIKESDGSSEGCHGSRADAIKQQRALYANESRVASMYAELDARPDPVPVVALEPASALAASALSPLATELVGLLLKDEREKSLVASMADSQAQLVRQQAEQAEERQALVAALTRMGQPIINVPAAEVTVTVPETQVSVNVPAPEVTVNVPDVNVTVAAPEVTVRPEINLPSVQKTVTFERDPLTQQVTKAEVTET